MVLGFKVIHSRQNKHAVKPVYKGHMREPVKWAFNGQVVLMHMFK